MAFLPGIRLFAREGDSSPGSIRPDMGGEEEEEEEPYSMVDEREFKYRVKEEGGDRDREGRDRGREGKYEGRDRGREGKYEGKDRGREGKYEAREQRRSKVKVMDPLHVPEAVYSCPECHETFEKKIGLIRHLCSIIHYSGVLKADLPEESRQKPYQCPVCLKPNRDISTLLRHYGGTEGKLLELGCVEDSVLEDRPRKNAKQALVLPAPTMGPKQRDRWMHVRAAQPEKRKQDRSMEQDGDELAGIRTGRKFKVKPHHLNIVIY